MYSTLFSTVEWHDLERRYNICVGGVHEALERVETTAWRASMVRLAKNQGQAPRYYDR